MNPVEVLDAADPAAVRAFEEAFYKAFLPLSNPGIRRIWIWDDENRRLKTRIPYEDQTIYMVRNDAGEVETAYAINYSLRAFQFADYDFVPPEDTGTMVETLTTLNLVSGNFPRAYLFGWRDGLSRGRKFNYATCSEKMIRLHVKAGFEVLDESATEGQKRFLIREDIDKSLQRFEKLLASRGR